MTVFASEERLTVVVPELAEEDVVPVGAVATVSSVLSIWVLNERPGAPDTQLVRDSERLRALEEARGRMRLMAVRARAKIAAAPVEWSEDRSRNRDEREDDAVIDPLDAAQLYAIDNE